MAWSRAFQKFIIYQFLALFFANIFTIKLELAKKIIFLQILKEEHKSFPMINDVSFVIFGHQTWDLEWGGGSN